MGSTLSTEAQSNQSCTDIETGFLGMASTYDQNFKRDQFHSLAKLGLFCFVTTNLAHALSLTMQNLVSEASHFIGWHSSVKPYLHITPIHDY